MRLAYICADPGVPVFGKKGCSIHVQEVIRAFMGQGIEVVLFAARLGGTPPAGLEALPVHRLAAPPKGEAELREKAALAGNQQLIDALACEASFDMIYERYSLWSYSGMEYAQSVAVPGVLEVNAPLIEEQAQHRALVDRNAAEQVAQRAFSAASTIIAVSEGVAEHVMSYSGTAGRVHVVPNGVDPERFGTRSTEAKISGAITIGFVGTLKPWHGLSTLVQAFATVQRHHPDTRLLVVGDGPERSALTAEVEAGQLTPFVEFTGAVDPDEIPAVLSRMDIAVAPYPNLSDFYFSPLKVYEYMAAGLPVVASRIGQLADLLQDGRNGVLCTPGDAEDLAQAVCRLVRDPATRRSLGEAARLTVLHDHTWANVAVRVLELARQNHTLECA